MAVVTKGLKTQLVVTKGYASGSAPAPILRELTYWTANAAYDATEITYDSPIRTYDSSSVRYDGVDQTKIIPEKTPWTPS